MEVEKSLKGYLVNGLRPEADMHRDAEYCSEYKGLRPTARGAREYEAVVEPFASGYLAGEGITVSHPFPQLFFGRGAKLINATYEAAQPSETLLCDESAIYGVDTSAWTVSDLGTPKDVHDFASNNAITAGGPWHFLDMDGNWGLINGSCFVIKSGLQGLTWQTGWVDAPATLVNEDVMSIATGCMHRGRMLLGGFDATNFWSSAWQSRWMEMASIGIPAAGDGWLDGSVTVRPAPDANWVWWGNIGGGDTFALFDPDFAEDSLYEVDLANSTSWNRMFDMMKRNQWGARPMDWVGEVLCVKPLGELVMVYGEGGVSALRPGTPGGFPTYGLIEKVLHTGIADRGAVGGDNRRHLLLDDHGTLWRIDEGLKIQKLGYEEYLADLLGDHTTISYDGYLDEWRISGGSLCFCLTPSGLCEATQVVNDCTRYDGGLVGIVDGAPDGTFQIDIEDLSFGTNDFKRLCVVEILYSGLSSVQVTPKFRFNRTDSYTSGSAVGGSPEGIFFPRCGGVEFGLSITGSVGTTPRIDDIIVRYEYGSARSIRGPARGVQAMSYQGAGGYR